MFDKLSKQEVEMFVKYKTSYDFGSNPGFRFIFEYYNDLLAEKNVLPKGPIQVGLNVTNRCNLRCKHCSRIKKVSTQNNDAFMTEWKTIINKLSECDVLQIFLTGGEPLLHPNIKEIISEIKQKNMLIGLLTNGMLFNEEMAEFIKSQFVSPFDYVHLSVDGLYNEYDKFRVGGNFNKIINTIKLLTDRNIRTHIVMVVTNENYLQMWDVYKFCIEHKVKHLKFMSLFEHDGTSLKTINCEIILKEFCRILEHYQKEKPDIRLLAEPISLIYPFALWLREKYPDIEFPTGKHVCPAASSSCEISVEGNVYPCSYLDDKQFYAGNIMTNNLEDIWVTGEVWNKMRKRSPENNKCKKCSENKNCLGGCPASSYFKHKDFNCGDSSCELLK